LPGYGTAWGLEEGFFVPTEETKEAARRTQYYVREGEVCPILRFPENGYFGERPALHPICAQKVDVPGAFVGARGLLWHCVHILARAGLIGSMPPHPHSK